MLFRTLRCDLNLAAFSLLSCLSGCAVVNTGATVVKAGATVVGTSVSVASTVVGTTVDVSLKAAGTGIALASAGVTAASTAKSVTVAAAGTAIAAGSVVAGAAVAASAFTAPSANRGADDVATAPVVAMSADRYVAQDGRQWTTRNCADALPGQPALWVAMRSGETEIRTSTGAACPVLIAN